MVVNAMRDTRGRYKWHVRQHLRPGQGVRPVIPPRRVRSVAPRIATSLTLVAWNINGLRNKRTDLELFLQIKRPVAMAMSETRRTAASWRLALPGYSCLERSAGDATKGEHGVALAVRPDFSMSEVGDECPYWVFGRW